MAYNDDDDIVVVRGRGHRGIVRNAATGLLKTSADDSPLKTLIVYGGAATGAWFLAKFLMGNVGQTLAEREVAQLKEAATVNPNSAAGLAGQLAAAFQTADGATTYWFTDVNEDTVFAIFEGRKITTVEFFREVALAYSKITKGSSLLTDLQNSLGSLDYKRVKPYLDKIMQTHRATPKKTGKTALAGLLRPINNAGR